MYVVKNLNLARDTFEIKIPQWNFSNASKNFLVGPSGCGKTSVVRALLGLELCPDLTWELDGENIFSKPMENRNLAAVFQDLELFPHMNAKENIQFPSQVKKRAEKTAVSQRYDLLIKFLNLESCLETKAPRLSGGERQRVALARALMSFPKFMILDEPFSALDESNKQQGFELLDEIHRLFQIGFLCVSHDVRFASDDSYFFKMEQGSILNPLNPLNKTQL